VIADLAFRARRLALLALLAVTGALLRLARRMQPAR
jgi:hypothetical protein